MSVLKSEADRGQLEGAIEGALEAAESAEDVRRIFEEERLKEGRLLRKCGSQ